MTRNDDATDGRRIDRRKILAGLGSGAAAGLAGCSGGGGDGGGNTPTDGGGTATTTETTMGGGTDSPTETQTSTGEPVEGGKPVIGIDKAPTTLNPLQYGSVYEGFIIDRIYQYGTTNNPNNQEFEPWLVTDWTLNPSNAVENPSSPTLEGVKIRDDMTFHDGEKVTADDFKFSVEYYRDQNPTQSLTGAAHQVVSKVEKQGDYEVDIYMNQKEQRWFTNILGFPVLPQHIWSNVDDFTKYSPRNSDEGVVGSGAWKLADYNWQNWYELETVDDYPVAGDADWLADGAPFVDGLRFEIFGSQNALEQALLNGELDAGYVSSGVTVNTAVQAENKESLQVNKSQSVGYNHQSYNLRRVPLDDKAFRQFLNKALDKKWIIEQPYQGIGAVPGDYTVVPALERWRPPEPEELAGSSYTAENLPTGDLPEDARSTQMPDLSFPGDAGSFNLNAQQIANIRQFLIDNPNATHDYSFGEAKTNLTRAPTGDIDSLDVPDAVKGAELYVNGKHLNEAHTNNAGESMGAPLEFSFEPPQGDVYQARTGQQYVGLLQKVGVPIEPQVQSFNSQLPKVYANENFDLFSMGWSLGVNVTHFSALYSSQGADLTGDVETQKFNPMGYTGADPLIEADRKLMDFSKRTPYVKQIQTEIYADAPTSVTEVSTLLEPTTKKYRGWFEGLGSAIYNEQSFLNIHQTG